MDAIIRRIDALLTAQHEVSVYEVLAVLRDVVDELRR